LGGSVSDTAGPTKVISDFEAKLEKADTSVAAFERDDKTLGHMVRSVLRKNPTAIPALILVASIVFFGALAPNFLKPSTLSLVLQQVTVTGIVAIAQTVVILAAGIDLSVSAILVLCMLIMGKLSVELGAPDWIVAHLGLALETATLLWTACAIVVGIAFGGLMGLLNGSLVTFLRLPPFIVTLGTLSIFNALKLWYSGSESVRASDIEDKAPFLIWFGDTFNVFGAQIALGGVALLVLAVVVWYLLDRTPWGRHVHAIGDDPDSALLAGIQVNRVLVSVYTFAGLVCGFCAWVAIGRVGSVSPIAFESVNLDSITATVIGGTSLFGGRGSIAGSVLGALIVGVFNAGLSLAGVDDYWQIFTVGVLVILAVAIDQWLRRASQ
jgi:fructose transport system permease protein